MGISDKLNEITAATENIQYNDPEQSAAAKKSSLYNSYLAARETAEKAPTAVLDAERAYFTYAEGPDGYDKLVKTRDSEETAQLKARVSDAHDVDSDRVDDALQTYATTVAYAQNLDGVLLAQLNQVIEMADDVKAGTDSQNTNNRKSSFLNAERSTVYAWDSRLTVAVWVLAAVYAKNHFPPSPIAVVVFGLLVASPWLLGLVGWLVGRRIPPFNAYTTFST
jgi:hypothetical protein